MAANSDYIQTNNPESSKWRKFGLEMSRAIPNELEQPGPQLCHSLDVRSDQASHGTNLIPSAQQKLASYGTAFGNQDPYSELSEMRRLRIQALLSERALLARQMLLSPYGRLDPSPSGQAFLNAQAMQERMVPIQTELPMRDNSLSPNHGPVNPNLKFSGLPSYPLGPPDHINRNCPTQTDATGNFYQNGVAGNAAGGTIFTGNIQGGKVEKKSQNFPAKLHDILSRPGNEDIISWSPHGKAWRVYKPKAFEEKILPMYFRHSQYTSFMRQVNGWGFERIMHGPDQNAYQHEFFVRDQPTLCRKMRRLVSSKSRMKLKKPNQQA
eukprot:CAMPEP_0183294098 /NCGR_PEP_ID=MMETSP0160_2-20130417/2550_1 /TAXON_ID=2839 ORGANISM="Odontella Sinensis, Strain Grunow 1884" /NCGR_SAMPLE_ID=MMETSP0160_2 /ASSEMBLY_ACC=CAM_ASM_000250 /LENGTH=323 /DNA_ID=CAMNT_0025455341 /DNA_START=89 /DNA_END=1060 /DNA_ORIENTATION=+